LQRLAIFATALQQIVNRYPRQHSRGARASYWCTRCAQTDGGLVLTPAGDGLLCCRHPLDRGTAVLGRRLRGIQVGRLNTTGGSTCSARSTRSTRGTAVLRVPSEVLVRSPEQFRFGPKLTTCTDRYVRTVRLTACTAPHRLRMTAFVGWSVDCVRATPMPSCFELHRCMQHLHRYRNLFVSCSLHRHAARTLRCNLHCCMLHCMLQPVVCRMLRI
jgi:hypothetical protein